MCQCEPFFTSGELNPFPASGWVRIQSVTHCCALTLALDKCLNVNYSYIKKACTEKEICLCSKTEKKDKEEGERKKHLSLPVL